MSRKMFLQIITNSPKSVLAILNELGLDFLQISPNGSNYEVIIKHSFFIGKNAKKIKKKLENSALSTKFIVFSEESIVEIKEIE